MSSPDLANADTLFLRPDVVDVLRAALDEVDPLARAPLLALLTVRVRHAADSSAYLLGDRPPSSWFSSPPPHLAALERSQLGLRGVRWVLFDPALFTALTLGLAEACVDRGSRALSLTIPAVAAPGEVAAARRILERAVADVAWDLAAPISLTLTARVECARGCFEIDAIRAAAGRAEIDHRGLTQTMLGLSAADAPRFLPTLIARGVQAIDPFVTRDPIVTLVADGVALPLPAAEPAPVRADKAPANVRTAADLVALPLSAIDALTRPDLDTSAVEPVALGIPAAPGVGVGYVALTLARAEQWQKSQVPYVLVVNEVYGEEASAIRSAKALLSARGSVTSHAAVVAAQSGVPCVIIEGMRVTADSAQIGHRHFVEGDWLSVDGNRGAVYPGALPVLKQPKDQGEELRRLLALADSARRLQVYANANTPAEASAAFAAGAVGVGLVRTEHMFLEQRRLLALRTAVLAGDTTAFTELQHEDFIAWLRVTGPRPCRFRLLDAPLAEFLPPDEASAAALAEALGLSLSDVIRKIDEEQPADSLMALRALRLSVVRPDLERAQLTALATAWHVVRPEAPLTIIVPMVSGPDELAAAIARIRALTGDIPLELSAMMELPRAVFRADAIARQVASFSWGSNDLTQFTLGLGRDVAAKIMPPLLAARAYAFDPGQSIDAAGVGRLIAHGEAIGKRANPSLRSGVCGRLASDPRSIHFFTKLGIDFVSVPPSQVAATRLAAAQAEHT